MPTYTAVPPRASSDGVSPLHESVESDSIASDSAPKDRRDRKDNKTRKHNPWTAGVRNRFPWAGASAIVLIICLTGAAGGILAASKDRPIDHWRVGNTLIQPQVWLSVLTTIMDGLTVFVLADAGTAYFWRRALKGFKLRELHDYHVSFSIQGAIRNLFRGRYNLICLASVLCLICALRAPLFQRASIVTGDFRQSSQKTETFSLAQAIPPGYFYGKGIPVSDSVFSVYDQYSSGSPIEFDSKGCLGSCTTKLQGFGFNTNCTFMTASPTSPVAQQLVQDAPGDVVPAFVVNASIYGFESDDTSINVTNLRAAEAVGRLDITSLFKPNTSCTADVSIHACSLHRAVVEYDVLIQNGTIKLQQPDWQYDKVLSNLASWNEFDSFPDAEDWSVTTVWLVIFSLLSENVAIALYTDGDGGPFQSNNPLDKLARKFLNSPTSISSVNCTGTTFRDPTQYLMNQMRELAFRAAVDAARIKDEGLLFVNKSLIESGRPLIQNWTQSVPVTDLQRITAYTVHVPYMISAIIVSLLAIPVLVSLYYGFWELGRSVSFGPLEIAKAFGAPHLDCCDDNADAQGIVDQLRDHQYQYGVVLDDDKKNGRRLRIDRTERIRSPRMGEIFQ